MSKRYMHLTNTKQISNCLRNLSFGQLQITVSITETH